jgi:hypothetical protein
MKRKIKKEYHRRDNLRSLIACLSKIKHQTPQENNPKARKALKQLEWKNPILKWKVRILLNNYSYSSRGR